MTGSVLGTIAVKLNKTISLIHESLSFVQCNFKTRGKSLGMAEPNEYQERMQPVTDALFSLSFASFLPSFHFLLLQEGKKLQHSAHFIPQRNV